VVVLVIVYTDGGPFATADAGRIMQALADEVIANTATSIISNAKIENKTIFLFTFFTSYESVPKRRLLP
jgi:hypothetical protein